MLGPARPRISGTASWARSTKLFTVTAKVLSIWWGFIVISGTNAVLAAFATSASRPPNVSCTRTSTGPRFSGSSWSACNTSAWPAERRHLPLERARRLRVPPVCRHHVPALAGQQQAHRTADATGASGHQHHPVRHDAFVADPEQPGVGGAIPCGRVRLLIAMGLLHGLWLLVVGALGAATIVARDRRGARVLTELEPYRG